MHNKLFVVDNVFAVSGGRNIADEYFGRSEPANFIDMDMFSAGPVVRELSAMFDGYWNSEHAYPIQSLAAPEYSSEAARRRFDETVRLAGVADLTVAARDPLGQSSIGSQLAHGRLELHMAAVRVIADAPAKAAPGDAPLAVGAAMKGKLELMQSARSEVLVASPYFVPGRRTLEVLKQATGNRVRVSVITNSLATTDEPLVHFGYARYRSALLQMGVSLYELMPGTEARNTVGELRGSLGRLHAKVAVVDQRWLYIGSLNMDRRSAHSNTEMGLIVDSPELAGQVASLLQGERLPRSYQVRSTADQPGLQWVAQDGEEKVVFADEPNANWGQRLRLSMLSMLVNEELL
jgi:putative cardiolipin synthase